MKAGFLLSVTDHINIMSHNPNENTKKSASFSGLEALILLTVFTVVTVVWFASPWLVTNLSELPYCSTEKRGQFGDSYAVTNTLFSGLAFVALIAALVFQRKDLMGQVKELGHQVSQFEQQNQLTRQQMVFQEIQTRIAAMPFLKISLSHDYGATYSRDPEPVWRFHLINEGPPIYNVRVHYCDQEHASIWAMKMSSGDTLNVVEKQILDNKVRLIWWQVNYVNQLGEPGSLRAEMPDNSEFTRFTEFDVEARKIHDEVSAKFKMKENL